MEKKVGEMHGVTCREMIIMVIPLLSAPSEGGLCAMSNEPNNCQDMNGARTNLFLVCEQSLSDCSTGAGG